MILVILGTQDKQFYRLLKIVENAKKKGIVKDNIIAQVGSTEFSSDIMEIHDYIPEDNMKKLIEKADLVVCHGGVGAITDALKMNKKVFSMARLKMYNEHRNDHQVQLVDKFNELGYIKKISDYDDFVREYKALNKFKPRKPKFDNTRILALVSNFIGK